VIGVGAARGLRLPTLSCDAFAPTASSASLQRVLGNPETAADSLPLGETEGDMLPATIFFPHDPLRRIAIVWRDTIAKRTPRYVWLSHGASAWRTRQGISVGTSLRTLERLNGRPFRLAGFAFDGSGSVTSWEGGRLATLSTGTCWFGMRIDSLGPLSPAERRSYQQVIGDRIFSSGHPAMQSLNPRVSLIVLEYQ
ncbi:MAG: hypothetical protein ACRD3J_24835, partial [Thermoanaerobaculia bacterium]